MANTQLFLNTFPFFYSDGFIDQFGGSNGKKLKYQGFVGLLASISSKNMHKQKNC